MRALLTLFADRAAAAVDVADDVAEILGFGHHFHAHDRLKQFRSAAAVRFAEAALAGDFKRQRRGVDIVELAIDQARLEVDDFVTGHLALAAFGADGMFDCRDVFARNAATDDLVGELDAGAGFAGFEDHLHFGVLAGTARLLLVRVDQFDRTAKRFAEADLGLAHHRFHAEFGAHAVDGDFQVQLAHALEHGFAGFLVHFQAQGRIGLGHLVERGGHLVDVVAVFRFHRNADHGVRETHALQQHG